MNKDVTGPLLTSNRITIYEKGFSINGRSIASIIEWIETIGDFVIFRTRYHGLSLAHKFHFWKDRKTLFGKHERIMLVYANILYLCEYFCGQCMLYWIDAASGVIHDINDDFKHDVSHDIDGLRRIIIRYLKSIGKEYDPRLMKYPQTIYTRIPRIVPVDHMFRKLCGFFDIIID